MLLALSLQQAAFAQAHAGTPAAKAPAARAPAPAAAPAAVPPASAATPRIGVMTMQPGVIFWERFGHDAIVVADPATGAATSYNFGFFDPSEPGFFGNFVRGRMQYMLVALPLQQDLATYREEGRGVSIQWLNLNAAQASRLAQALAEEARPENARYRYDYFTANCATKVRDALDDALGGWLHHMIAGRSRGNTYRSEAVRLASPAPWMWLGFDIGLSRRADRQLSRWEEAFVPMRLADSLDETMLPDGRPLVAGEQVLLPHRIAPQPPESARPWWPWLLAGLALAAAALLLGALRPRLLAAVASAFWLACGLLGALELFIWLGTEHRAGWGNENLLLFSPLCLLLLPGAWRIARGRGGGRLFHAVLAAVALGAAAALLLKWVLLFSQVNQPWIALLLPLHLALYVRLRRR
ncbi:DUF4105 domain-containing protein [Luteimonas sp. 50]|uniref:DUF4105 domain-containing protein n=1 Tax=Cognatiluteimonas sedimenti TaxID=2927791 RepID=A0ABT0A4H1_9GAMM|nr:DUF4105 domain-containing protein [Lysobacter sedimenti]MCJ0825883.1 DUF4105 domain-containing protein [Lysobacter sedimenti]